MRWFFSMAFVDAFARELVDELAAQMPAGLADDAKRKSAARYAQRMTRSIRLLQHKVAEFNERERPNVLQRLRLSKSVQDGLLAKGYPVEISRQLAVEVVTSG